MKRIFSVIFIMSLALMPALAQKFAFVDTEYILQNIPAYKSAQTQLENLSKTWQEEIDKAYAEVENLYKNYQTERLMLSDDMRKKKEEEIVKKEQSAQQLQQKYYGNDGELSKKQEELIKPIQEEIYKAVKELALDGGYAAIFDTSADATVLYANPKQDKSDEVLSRLGYKR